MRRGPRICAALTLTGLALGSCTIETAGTPAPAGAGASVVTSTSLVVVDPPAPPASAPATPATTPPQPAGDARDPLGALAQSVAATYGGSVGIAVAGQDGVLAGGDEGAYPAWSTIKVPLAVAAYRSAPGVAQTHAAAAITQSDNAAAQSLWDALPPGAADQVLSEAGVGVAVNTAPIRPEFSTFGQTLLTTGQEATLASHLRCTAGAGPVLSLMGQVSPAQSYGLGQLPGALFKGGWGPDTTGGYQVRQLGLVPRPDGSEVAVALTVIPAGGDYATGQAMAGAVAEGLKPYLATLPASAC